MKSGRFADDLRAQTAKSEELEAALGDSTSDMARLWPVREEEA